jgi:hypothetical protein
MDYKEIKVYLHTNLESLPHDKRDFLFESSQIIHPQITTRSRFKKYPSISREATQNFAKLSELTFQQRMEFFFNTEENLQLLRIYPDLFEKNERKYSKDSPKEYFKQYNAIIKKNIEIMLTLLFVATPLNGINVTSSWEFVVNKLQVPRLPTAYGFFTNMETSMIKINNKEYSFDRLIWMNDILNCPVYSKLFLRYRSFLRWKENEYQKIRTIHNSNDLDDDIKEAKIKMYEILIMLDDLIINLKNCFKTFINSLGNDKETLFTEWNLIAFYKLFCVERLVHSLLYKTRNNKANNYEEIQDKMSTTTILKAGEKFITKYIVTQYMSSSSLSRRQGNFINVGDNMAKIVNPFNNKNQGNKIIVFKDSPTLAEKIPSTTTTEDAINNFFETVVDEFYIELFTKAKAEFNTILIAFINTIIPDGKPIDNPTILGQPIITTKTALEEKIIENLNIIFSKADKGGTIDYLFKLIRFIFNYSYSVGNVSDNTKTNINGKWKDTDSSSSKPYFDIIGSGDKGPKITSELAAQFNTSKTSLLKLYNDSIKTRELLAASVLNKETINKKEAILDIMLKKTTKNVYKEYGALQKDPQYTYFVEQYIRNILSFKNKSTNRILQELINMQKDFEAETFFQFLDRAYKYFYEGKGEPFKADEDQTYWLYTGVNEKYESDNIENIWEIHVLCDLYLGSSGKLYGQQNCQLKGQELGKNLELVLTENVDTLEKNRQRWDLNYRRILYSEEGASVQNSEETKKKNKELMMATEMKDTNQPEAPNPNKKSTNLNPNIFQDIIDKTEAQRDAEYSKEKSLKPEERYKAFNDQYPVTSSDPSNLKKLWYPDNSKSFLETINNYFRNRSELRNNQPDFQKTNLLDVLRDSKDDLERNLYDGYVKFNKEQFLYKSDVAAYLDRLSGKYSAEVRAIRRDQEAKLRGGMPENSAEYLKLALLCSKYYFYMKVVDQLLERENKKPRINAAVVNSPNFKTGGTKRKTQRRRRVSKKKVTKKTHRLLKMKRL